MPEPLDYRNAKAPDPVEPAKPPAPREAIPIEFDAIVTRTTDLAGARAIEDQLERDGVEVFRAEDTGATAEAVVLLVRGCDLPHATQVANIIFTRRRKLKSLRRNS
jgi:hypothetical protein